MQPDKDSQGLISIMEMTPAEAEIVHTAVTRMLNDLPTSDQIVFRGLLIKLEKIIPLK